MNIIAKHNDLPFGVFGDIHGEVHTPRLCWELIREKIRKHQLENIICFVAGDFGVGFNYNDNREPRREKIKLLDFNKFLKKRNIFLYIVRGNHDSPIFFDGLHNFTNVIFMQDYDVVEIGEYAILGIGGATSVDRKPNHHFKDYRGHDYPGRKENINWWQNEKVVYDEEKLNAIAGIDVVITHTCPDFIYPPVLGGDVWKWCDCDPELKNELIEERELMGRIYNKLNEMSVIKEFVYGHFHQSNLQIYNNTKFKLLDIGEFHEVIIKGT